MSAGALRLAGPAEATALIGYLRRLLHFDKGAAVRVRAPEGAAVVAVFGRPPFGTVLAMRTLRLAAPPAAELDATVSAGQLLEAVAEEGGELVVPDAVAGVAWAGMLPPRGGWEPAAELDAVALRSQVRDGIAVFKERVESLPEPHRTRSAVDAEAERVWSAPIGGAPDDLPLRVAHTAYALGFLPPSGEAAPPARVLRSGTWWRLGTGYGEVAYRAPSGLGLQVV